MAGVSGEMGFLAAAKACAAQKADLCTDSQSWVVRRTGMMDNAPNWTNSFSDNDANAWNEVNGGTSDNNNPNSAFLAPCCLNLTPVRPSDQTVQGIRVVLAHDVADTYFRTAARTCASMQADLCDKGQYWVLRQAGLITVGVWSSDHSDNDSVNFDKGLGPGVSDNPLLSDKLGFACCATRSTLSCPGTETQGVCHVSVNNLGGTWDMAANDCAAHQAHLCSIGQSAVLRAAGVITAVGNWTGSYSDNDGNGVSVGVGAVGDDHPNNSVYGWACCL